MTDKTCPLGPTRDPDRKGDGHGNEYKKGDRPYKRKKVYEEVPERQKV